MSATDRPIDRGRTRATWTRVKIVSGVSRGGRGRDVTVRAEQNGASLSHYAYEDNTLCPSLDVCFVSPRARFPQSAAAAAPTFTLRSSLVAPSLFARLRPTDAARRPPTAIDCHQGARSPQVQHRARTALQITLAAPCIRQCTQAPHLLHAAITRARCGEAPSGAALCPPLLLTLWASPTSSAHGVHTIFRRPGSLTPPPSPSPSTDHRRSDSVRPATQTRCSLLHARSVSGSQRCAAPSRSPCAPPLRPALALPLPPCRRPSSRPPPT